MQSPLFDWCRSLVPAPLPASPLEWLRAACGVALVLLLTLGVGNWLFDSDLTLRLAGPAAASAVLLFAASSSPFAQPWPILGGNLIAALVTIGLGQGACMGCRPRCWRCAWCSPCCCCCAARIRRPVPWRW